MKLPSAVTKEVDALSTAHAALDLAQQELMKTRANLQIAKQTESEACSASCAATNAYNNAVKKLKSAREDFDKAVTLSGVNVDKISG